MMAAFLPRTGSPSRVPESGELLAPTANEVQQRKSSVAGSSSPLGQRPKTAGSPTPHSPTTGLSRTGSAQAGSSPSRGSPDLTAGIGLVRRRPQTTGSPLRAGRVVTSPLRPNSAALRPASGTMVLATERPASPFTKKTAGTEAVTASAAAGAGAGEENSARPSSQAASASASPRSQTASPRPPSTHTGAGSGVLSSADTLKRSSSLLRESALLRERVAAQDYRISASSDDLQSTILNGPVTRLNDVRATEREKSNQTVYAATRNIRQEVAHLRQAVARLGEEQKLLGKNKSLLEVGIQDKRKGLSVNHQSQAMRQKMSSRDQRLTDGCNLVLAREAKQLSQSKHDLEKQLTQVKNQQWEVDKLRKQMATRAQSLSSGPLALDHHHPRMTSSATGGQERFATSLRKPPKSVQFSADDPTGSASGRSPLTSTKGTHDPTTTFISQAEKILATSKQLREASKKLLLSTAEQVSAAKNTTDRELLESGQRAHLDECKTTVERGQVRRARAATVHALSCHELAAARARGAMMEEHWNVSEKATRPLISVEPHLAAEEVRKQKQSVDTFNMHASQSATSLDRLSGMDARLALAMRQKAAAYSTEMDVLRMRRRSADNRWVKGR